jgi:transcriptional regulator with XRE-family HTH domain
MIEKNLGTLVRQLREGRGLSLRSLAERSGFSGAFLSQVENGQASPSISSMERIASALGVTMGEFFRAAEKQHLPVVRASERIGLSSGWSRAKIESLGASQPGRKLEGVVIVIQPGGTSGKDAYPLSSEQIAVIFEGELELTLGDEEHKLWRGDSATLRAGVPRRWRNVSDKPAQVMIVSEVS